MCRSPVPLIIRSVVEGSRRSLLRQKGDTPLKPWSDLPANAHCVDAPSASERREVAAGGGRGLGLRLAPDRALRILRHGATATTRSTRSASLRLSRPRRPSRRAPRVRGPTSFVLTDDLSMNPPPYLPAVQRLQRQGTTLSHYYVADSPAAPPGRRSSPGQYPTTTASSPTPAPTEATGLTHAHGDAPEVVRAGPCSRRATGRLPGKYLNGDRTAEIRPRPAGTPGTRSATAITSSTTTRTSTARSALRHDVHWTTSPMSYPGRPALQRGRLRQRSGTCPSARSRPSHRTGPTPRRPRYAAGVPGAGDTRAASRPAGCPATPPAWLITSQP